MEVKGAFCINPKDHLKFSFYHQRKILIQMPFLVFILCICINYLIRDKIDIFSLYLFFVAGIFIIILLALAIFFQSKNIFKSHTLAGICVENTINNDGIQQNSELGNIKLPYDKVYKICETKTAFYIYISKAQAIIMQKRYFKKLEDVQTIKTLFSKNINKKKLKLLRQ